MSDDATPAKVRLTDGLGALVAKLRDPSQATCWGTADNLMNEAADMLERLEPMDMALCERHKLVLRVGQPYIFAPVGDCESCAADLAAAREAYGPSAGAPND